MSDDLSVSSTTWVVTAMVRDDLTEILQIETNTPSSWTMSQLEGELLQGCGCHLVARAPQSNHLVGYLFGRIVADEAEIIKLAVRVESRRRGIAETLLENFYKHLQQRGVNTCYLEFRTSNLAARNLYEKNKFYITGVRKNYYNDPMEDACCMTKTIEMNEESA